MTEAWMYAFISSINGDRNEQTRLELSRSEESGSAVEAVCTVEPPPKKFELERVLYRMKALMRRTRPEFLAATVVEATASRECQGDGQQDAIIKLVQSKIINIVGEL